MLLIVIMKGDEFFVSDAQMIEKIAGVACVFTGNDPRGSDGFHGSKGDIAQVSYWSSNELDDTRCAG